VIRAAIVDQMPPATPPNPGEVLPDITLAVNVGANAHGVFDNVASGRAIFGEGCGTWGQTGRAEPSGHPSTFIPSPRIREIARANCFALPL